ncbi:MAG: amino acid permease, partial [Pyrinomonadaceae bacterium]
DLIIEYAVGNIAVAISWANYFRSLMSGVGIDIPAWLATDFRTARNIPGLLENAPHIFGKPIVFNLLAFGIVALITTILVWGIRESAGFNAGMVMIKILILLFFIGTALYFVSPAKMATNWHPFQPRGWGGTLAGAAIVFFAFIGFDAVSTVAEETRNPTRDLPIGIIASLIICTIFYVIVAAVFTGLIPHSELVQRLATEQAEPLTMALNHVAPAGVRWPSTVVAFGAVIANTAVLLVFQLGQPRIFFSMARDGLLPPVFARIHPRFKTPHVTTILTGVFVGVIAAVASIDEMIDLTNIGTLFAFVLVCIGIPVMRLKDPGRVRPFRVPFGAWIFPMLGAASCLFLMYYLPPASWWRFIGWLMLGLGIYTSYGYSRSLANGAIGTSRPVRKSPLLLKIAGFGFILTAFGLFMIPHNAGLFTLVSNALTTDAETHSRSLWGLIFIIIGLAVGLTGSISNAVRSNELFGESSGES